METLLCLQVLAPCPPHIPLPPPLPPPYPHLPILVSCHHCCFHLCHPELLGHPGFAGRILRSRVRRDLCPFLQCCSQARSWFASPTGVMEPGTHLFSRLRRRVFSLLEQSLRFRRAGPLLLFSTRMRAWISVFIWNCTRVLISGL